MQKDESTVCSREQSGVLVVNTESDREDREDVEDEDAEKRRADRARDGLVRARTLPGRERDELDAAVGVEREHERLCEVPKPPDERLAPLEIRETLCGARRRREVTEES